MIHQYLTIRAVRESDAKLGMDLIAENVGSKNASACLFKPTKSANIRASPLPIKKPKKYPPSTGPDMLPKFTFR
jgi:hypothetical protein